jgi:hypothetical protein
MNGYVSVDLTDLKQEQKAIINAVINEGRMRRNDEVLEKIERKITEAYAQDNRDLVEFLEELIRDLELDM